MFEAARANDEAAFTAALAGVPHPGDYADDGRPLLHVLLMPPRVCVPSMSIGTCRRTNSAPARRAPRRAAGAHAHAGGAAGRKPALNDATYQSRRTALQLALLYGSPQIVDMLLAAGADPNQAGDEGRKPLEFLLDRDFEFAVRMTYLPRLVDRPDMARMVQALLKAGAQRPFQGLDDAKPGGASALTDAAGEPRRMADFLSWNPLVELTEGGDVLRAFAATGTRPAFDNEVSPLALAAYRQCRRRAGADGAGSQDRAGDRLWREGVRDVAGCRAGGGDWRSSRDRRAIAAGGHALRATRSSHRVVQSPVPARRAATVRS